MRFLFFLLLICYSSLGQTSSKDFVDLHNHVTLKNYIRSIEHPDSIDKQLPYSKHENWYSLSNYYNPREKSNQENFFQSDFTNLAESGFKIICTSITPLEQNATYGPLKRQANSSFETHIFEDRLKNAYAATPIDDFFAELKFLKNQQTLELVKGEKYQFQLVSNKDDLLNCMNKNKTAIIVNIEGAHVLYGPKSKINHSFLSPAVNPEIEKEMLDNVERLKNCETRILSISICHLFSNKIAGHAKALDISNNSKFNQFFIRKLITVVYGMPLVGKLLDVKQYEGLRNGKVITKSKKVFVDSSTIGVKVFKAFLDSNNIHKKPILIDIKHMDVKSRWDYYNMLNTVSGLKNIPIFCSHGAASGKNEKLALITGTFPYYDRYQENRKPEKFYRIHWKSWKKKFGITDKDYPSQVNFLNPFSINLYDEEIKRIYDSKGLIGIILEERALGGYMKGYEWERTDTLKNILMKRYTLSEDDALQYINTEPYIRNLFYFVEKSGRNDATAFDALGIGTDMDGFIDPINSCLTSGNLPQFAKKVQQFIPIFLKINYGNEKLLFGLTPQEIVRKIFIENGENFILRNF